LANPLAGVEVTEPGIKPLWAEGQKYDIICFLSRHSSLQSINIEKIFEKNQVIFQQNGLVHQSHQQQISLQMSIKSKQSTLANGTVISKDIFKQIQSNSSNVFLHVIVKWPEYSYSDIQPITGASTPGWWLHGSVRMIKYDAIPRSFRYRYLLSDFGWVENSPIQEERQKWAEDTIVSYWKPEVSVHMVADFAEYPFHIVPEAVSRNIVVRKSKQKKADKLNDAFYRPSIYVDEIGLTSDRYIYLNDTVQDLPLKISIGPMSSQRWLLTSILEEALLTQKSFGFSDRDIDDIRRMVTETSLSFLLVTMIASVLHLLFEFLAFRSDVNFWKDNKSLAGLSTRTLITDLISQVIVFLYLIESDASMLVTIPSFISVCIQLWKAKKATGFSMQLGGRFLIRIQFKRWQISGDHSIQQIEPSESNNSIVSPSACNTLNHLVTTSEPQGEAESAESKLVRVTLEADRVATQYLGGLLLPCVLAYIMHTLIYQRHLSWYSWAIGSLTSCVYTFGFVLMTPQLYINRQLKSVSHLPWQYLIYKFLNTFVDDLFAFIIKMPMMHRLSVFRDDIVFLIYLYQRWTYRVDTNRPYEK
jgi:hypothetical protein